MDNQVRLLPALIGAAAVVIVLRLVAMSVGAEASVSGSGTAAAAEAQPAGAPPSVAAAAPAATSAPAAPDAGAAATTQAGTTAAPAAADANATTAQAAAPAVPAAASDKPAETAPASSCAGQAQNKGEADILHALADRRTQLDARENDLSLREQMLAVTQKQVDDKIVQLKDIQGKLDVLLQQRDDAQKAQLTSLVKMYEAMKPGEAARIFEKLDPKILVDVAGGMKPAKVGLVLAQMEPARAQEITALLANRTAMTLPAAAPLAAPTAMAAPVPAPAAGPADQQALSIVPPSAAPPTP